MLTPIFYDQAAHQELLDAWNWCIAESLVA